MSNWYDFTGVRNEPFSAIISVTDSDGVTPFNLSGYAFTGGVRYRYTEGDIVAFSINLMSPPTSGTLAISLTNNETSTLPSTECIHYIKGIPPTGAGNFVLDLAEGYFEIFPL
jgi:hypothetical protein